MDCKPPGSSLHGISQARTLEGVIISFSRRASWPRDETHLSFMSGGFFITEPPGKHYEQLYTNGMGKLEETVKFLERYNLLREN